MCCWVAHHPSTTDAHNRPRGLPTPPPERGLSGRETEVESREDGLIVRSATARFQPRTTVPAAPAARDEGGAPSSERPLAERG